MLKEAGYSAQDLMNAGSDAGVRMAIFNGIIRETKNQVGDAAKLAKDFGGQLSMAEENVRKLHVAIGAAIQGPLGQWLEQVNGIIVKITDWINKNQELAGTLTLTITGIAAVVLAGSGLLLIFDKIIKTVVFLKNLMVWNDLVFAFRAAAGGAATFAEAMGFLSASFTPFLVTGIILTGLIAISTQFRIISENARRAKMTIDEFNSNSDIDKEIKELDRKIINQQALITYYNKMKAGGGKGATKDEYDQLVRWQNRREALQHKSDVISGKEKPSVVCPYDGKVFKTQTELDVHIKAMHTTSITGKYDRDASISAITPDYATMYEAQRQQDLLALEGLDGRVELTDNLRERSKALADEITQMTGTQSEQDQRYYDNKITLMEEEKYAFQQIEDWKAAYHLQKLNEQKTAEAGMIADLITRKTTIEDVWRQMCDEILRKWILTMMGVKSETGNTTSILEGLFGWLSGLGSGGSGSGGAVPAPAAASRGAIIPAATNGMILPPSFGTDTVLTALTPREMVLPVNISEGLQNLINQGSQPQIVNNYNTTNNLSAIDTQSGMEFLYNNRDTVVGLVGNNIKSGGTLRRTR
jgi:hypothetical protein